MKATQYAAAWDRRAQQVKQELERYAASWDRQVSKAKQAKEATHGR